ncbi:hypothetical protein [Chitinophaga nivalis]|uniref:Uncharacterized protein n=1 Tax=Chitinophaga nivalis TaxID=2991709 RepID=A0ABT3IIQ3_9BACT|nr:hypothetical protein [Chitinophaga nivalis]MCW3466500.1 hypothetical protein [Chitinophaga nivalis]MCW3483809.1 hypothetical protein [Chitinophaga nivalis]
MPEKYLKVIQNGNTTFIPDNQRNRSFWTKQNTLVSRSKSALSEIVTVLPASDDEVSHMQHSDVGTSMASNHTSAITQDNSAIFEFLNRLQKQNDSLNEKISELTAEREKGKPGPKPKQ